MFSRILNLRTYNFFSKNFNVVICIYTLQYIKTDKKKLSFVKKIRKFVVSEFVKTWDELIRCTPSWEVLRPLLRGHWRPRRLPFPLLTCPNRRHGCVQLYDRKKIYTLMFLFSFFKGNSSLGRLRCFAD